MKVEIWSDIVCPFCYLGKRKFEKALELFPYKDKVEVEWHSYQLDPQARFEPGLSIHEYLAGKKAISIEDAKIMHGKLAERVKEYGLQYEFDRIIPANTFDAHRLIQFAKTKGLQAQAEESLFHAYFSDGINIADHTALIALGREISLDIEETSSMLNGDEFTEEVRKDLYEAHSIGIQGVPYFVFNDKYAISGAQESSMFLGALTRTWNEMHYAINTEVGKN